MLASVTLTFDSRSAHADVVPYGGATWPDRFPTGRSALVDVSGSVAALRRRACVAAGSLHDRAVAVGSRLVSATDTAGDVWLIPAAAVWSDWETAPDPQHPLPIGLATGASPERVLVAGLSDRLGWEAVMHFERGADLPVIKDAPGDARRLVVLDGRIGHDVPTVLLLGDDVLRWGAGLTWADAVRRALFGHGHGHGQGAEHAVEAAAITVRLAAGGLVPATVDLGSAQLQRCGIVRSSVQLLASST